MGDVEDKFILHLSTNVLSMAVLELILNSYCKINCVQQIVCS